ncbi:MAG: T9SS type A sorting domain-containing protein [Fibrobacteres bacterium]|nr:T9SS type A sorting domain-containing protein [Fibrobacterota bacterium]
MKQTRILLILISLLITTDASVLNRPLKLLYYGDSFGGYVKGGILKIIKENYPVMNPEIGGHSANGWYVTQNFMNYWPNDKYNFMESEHKYIFFQDAGRVDPDFRTTMQKWVPEAIDAGFRIILTDNCDSASWYTSQNVASTNWNADNIEIRRLAAQYNLLYLPMAAIELAAIRRLGESAILGDGLHPTANASHMWAMALLKGWGADIKNLKYATTGIPTETAKVYADVVDSIMNLLEPLYLKTVNGLSISSSATTVKEWRHLPLISKISFSDTSAEKNISGQSEWHSTDTSVLSVSPIGVVYAKKAGTAKITAEYRGFTDTISITVAAESSSPDSIVFVGISDTLTTGTQLTITSTAYYSDGGKRDISAIAALNSSTPSVISVYSNTVKAETAGASIISITLGSTVKNKSVTVIPEKEKLLIVDFGTSESNNRFGAIGWDCVLRDVGTAYSNIGNGGILTESGPDYNYQGASGAPIYLSAGDVVKVTWKNLGYLSQLLKPFISFNDPNRMGNSYPPIGTWSAMSEATLLPHAETSTMFTISNQQAGKNSLINIFGGYQSFLTVVCEKIEIIRCGRSILPSDPVLDSIQCIKNTDSLVAGDSISLNIVAFYHKEGQTYKAIVDSVAQLSTDNPQAFTFSRGVLKGVLSCNNAKIFAEYQSRKDTITITVLQMPSFIRRINFQKNGIPFRTGWQADTGAKYTAQTGFGWVERIVGDVRDDRSGPNFLLKSFCRTSTATTWHIDAPDGNYFIRLGVGDNLYGTTAQNSVSFEGNNIIQYAGSPLLYDTLKGIFGQANGLSTKEITVSGGKGIDLLVNGAINYLIICSAAENTPIKFIADDMTNINQNGTHVGADFTSTSTEKQTLSALAAPNPFNPQTAIIITGLHVGSLIEISLYSTDGKKVKSQMTTARNKKEMITMNPGEIAGGKYVLSVFAEGKKISQLITFLK